MRREILIDSATPETRVALLEDDVLTEVFIERPSGRGITGNIYKGRVSNVLPGMQAAFVDIGTGRDAFLYVQDIRRGVEDEGLLELARGVARDLHLPGGFIVRTACEGRGSGELLADAVDLASTWDEVRRRAEVVPTPALLHQEAGAVVKVLRDVLNHEVHQV